MGNARFCIGSKESLKEKFISLSFSPIRGQRLLEILITKAGSLPNSPKQQNFEINLAATLRQLLLTHSAGTTGPEDLLPPPPNSSTDPTPRDKGILLDAIDPP